MANTTLPDQQIQDLIQLAQTSLRLVSDLQRAAVPVSPTTVHALLNEAAIAIEALRSTLGPMESHEEVFARLAPWAPPLARPVAPSSSAEGALPTPKRTRRTKAEMEADAAAEAAKKAAPAAAPAEPSPEAQGGLSPIVAAFDASAASAAITNPMPVEAAAVTPAEPAAGVPVVAITTTPDGGLAATTTTVDALPTPTPEPTQPGFDRDKAEAALKKTGDDFRASEAQRREREALAATRPVATATTPASAGPYPPSSPDWKAKLHLAPQPEDAALPFKNGDYAGKKFSDCSIRDLEIIMANYVKGVEGETDPEKRAQRSLWLERGSAWYRYRFDLLLLNAGHLDMDDLRAEYATKASAPGPSPAMQMHRMMWLERIDEIAAARKEHEA